MNKEVTILGAGIAGLSAALKLKQSGIPYKLFEKASTPGGLLRNFSVEGFRFDHAIHLSFAKEPEVRSIFDKTEYYCHHPESKCFDNDRWLRHPIQNNLHPLPVSEKVELIKGFVERPAIEVKNYADWLNFQYGYQFTDRYPRRYTRKYWDCQPEALGVNWIGNRMHRATLDEVLTGAMTESVPNYYYAKEMRYPKRGGYISFLSPLLKEVEVRQNKNFLEIDPQRKLIEFEDGTVESYCHLINTSPLPSFVEKMKQCPEHIRELAKSLQWTKVHLISFGFNKPNLVKDLWFYIYDDDIFAARAYSPSLKSPDNCPPNCSSLQFEVYQGSTSDKAFSQNDLVNNCIYALQKLKIAEPADISVVDAREIEFGNVSFHSGMEDCRNEIIAWLNSQGIVPAGRFGEWDYLWSNQAMMSGFRAAEKFICP